MPAQKGQGGVRVIPLIPAQDLAALSAEVGHIARLQSQAAGRQRQVA